MKVIQAKTAGFCMGVRRAIEMILTEVTRKNSPLYTYGPVIHNNQVLDLLASKGVRRVHALEGLTTGRLVIRAHGIPPQERERIRKSGLKVIDATCPKVAKVQAIIRSYTRKGYRAIIVGDRDHAEVVGLMGYSETQPLVIQGKDQVEGLPELDRAFVVAQTTQNEETFREGVEALQKKYPQILVFDTICDATHRRQKEVRAFAGHVDAVVVVGGYHSGNTQRLVQVAKEAGLQAFHVETERDIDKGRFQGMETLGVTAGASTPNWMISGVVEELEGIWGHKETRLIRFFKTAFNGIVLSNGLLALAAMSFSHAACLLADRPPGLLFPLLAFFYVYAMHVLNRFMDKAATAFSDPRRAAFLKQHKVFLMAASLLGTSAALVMATLQGLPILLGWSGLALLGILYSVPLFPRRMRYSRIKDIPGSQSLSEALAWVAVMAGLPLLTVKSFAWTPSIIAALMVFLMGYGRSILFSMLQAQGDLMAGRESLPIILGERRTLLLLKGILFSCGILLVGAPLLGWVKAFSWALLLPLTAFGLCLVSYEKGWMPYGTRFEAMVEGSFLLTGILAILWQIA